MQRIPIFSLLLVMLFSLAMFANEESAESLREKENQAKELAQEILTGRQAMVRIYNNGQDDPRAFEQVGIPLDGISIGFDSISSAFGQMSELAIIVVTAEDQKDEIVAAVIGDFVYVQAYREGKSFSIWPTFFRGPGHKWWTFKDALGNPIPHASVEIRATSCDEYSTEFWICNATLDEKGQLERLKRGNSSSKFIFIVSHPDYGTAKVEASGCPSLDNSPITYVVPLVPIASEAGNRAIWGFVADRQGNPVRAAEITCFGLKKPGGERLPLYKGFIGRSITDEQGWFTMYMPVEDDGMLTNSTVPPMVKYRLMIMPPKNLNLRQYNGDLVAGKQFTITLGAMRADEYFHTFVFEYAEGPIIDLEELKKITIELYRDSRKWLSLKYDDWKAGSYLPLGTLCASTPRWGDRFSFRPIELTVDSPEELIFSAAKQIIYQGRVVNGLTGDPMPGVLVLIDHSYSRKEPSSLESEEWEELRTQAAEDFTEGLSNRKLYDYMDRLTLTDANGCYEVIFMPGFNTRLCRFTALEKGFVTEPVSTMYREPNADGIIEVPAIKLSPPKPIYFPTLVFEDEFGPVTDPEILGQIQLRVEKGRAGIWRPPTYDHWMKIGRFEPGIYYATANWNDKRYIFEPVDLTQQRPETVVFKIKEIREANILYRGQVVHGITGQPIPGAIVMGHRLSSYRDASELEPEQWDAISSLGPEFGLDDPTLVPIKEILGSSEMTLTDSNGGFQLTLPTPTEEDRRSAAIIAIRKDYLGAQQQLRYSVPADANIPHRRQWKEFQPNENGYATLPPMRLFPAGTIIIEPNVPVEAEHEDVRLNWFTFTGHTPEWLEDLGDYTYPIRNKGGSLFYKYHLRPYQIETVYVAAGVEMTIKAYIVQENRFGHIVIPGVKLEQGQILDLGRRDFPPTFRVAIQVIDSSGEPVGGVTVSCTEDGLFRGQKVITDEDGIAIANVTPRSKGEFVVSYHDRVTETHLREGIPYEVGGEEDIGKQITLQISDEMLYQLFK